MPWLGRVGAVAIVLGAALWTVGWIRIARVLGDSRAPLRRLSFQTPDGNSRMTAPHCADPAIIDGDPVWRLCPRPGRDTGADLVHVDYARGVARVVGSLPAEGLGATILQGVTRLPTGELAFLLLSGSIYVADADGTLTRRATVGSLRNVAGFAAVGGDLEIIAHDGTIERIVIHGTAQTTHTIPPPEYDASHFRQRLVAALRERGEWRFTFLRAPGSVGRGGPSVTETAVPMLIETDERGEVRREQPVPSPHVDTWLQLGIEGSPSGIVFPADHAVANVLIRAEGEWRRVAVLDPADEYLGADFRFEGSELRWQPRVHRDYFRTKIDDRWITVTSAPDGVRVEEGGGAHRPPVARNPGGSLRVFPAVDGGFWLSSTNGGYARLDRTLNRIDRLTYRDRIGGLYTGQSWTDRWDYRAAVPILLLFPILAVPLAAVGAAVVPGRRPGRCARWLKVAGILAGAVIITLFPSFWSATGLL